MGDDDELSGDLWWRGGRHQGSLEGGPTRGEGFPDKPPRSESDLIDEVAAVIAEGVDQYKSPEGFNPYRNMARTIINVVRKHAIA